jgi:hypothetical protein
MSVACELAFETYTPRLYALPDQPARLAPSPRVRRRRVVLASLLAAFVLVLLTLLALPIRSFGGSTLAQIPAAPGQEYVVKTGDTLGSIAAQADPEHQGSMVLQLARETGSRVVVPGEHLFIP